MKTTRQMLEAEIPRTNAVAVDRVKKVLRGFVVAQAGPFKTPGRGSFDVAALEQIIVLGNAAPNGLPSNFGHETLIGDSLGKFLGRAKNFRMSTAVDTRTRRVVPAVRADLHFDPTAHKTPHGDLAGYLLELVESDPGSVSASLTLDADQKFQRGGGAPAWMPTELVSVDVVARGDATDGLLSHAIVPRTPALNARKARLAAMQRTYKAVSVTPRLDARRARLADMARCLEC